MRVPVAVTVTATVAVAVAVTVTVTVAMVVAVTEPEAVTVAGYSTRRAPSASATLSSVLGCRFTWVNSFTRHRLACSPSSR